MGLFKKGKENITKTDETKIQGVDTNGSEMERLIAEFNALKSSVEYNDNVNENIKSQIDEDDSIPEEIDNIHTAEQSKAIEDLLLDKEFETMNNFDFEEEEEEEISEEKSVDEEKTDNSESNLSEENLSEANLSEENLNRENYDKRYEDLYKSFIELSEDVEKIKKENLNQKEKLPKVEKIIIVQKENSINNIGNENSEGKKAKKEDKQTKRPGKKQKSITFSEFWDMSENDEEDDLTPEEKELYELILQNKLVKNKKKSATRKEPKQEETQKEQKTEKDEIKQPKNKEKQVVKAKKEIVDQKEKTASNIILDDVNDEVEEEEVTIIDGKKFYGEVIMFTPLKEVPKATWEDVVKRRGHYSYHLTEAPNGGYFLKRAKVKNPYAYIRRKDEALKLAKIYAEREKADLKVHNEKGVIEKSFSFGRVKFKN